MDYVVAGFGIGAILALIGFALWELFGEREEPGTGWLSRAAIGLMLGALVIWAITGVSLISHTDDSTGSHLVLLTTLVTLVSIAAGSYWYWRADQAILASMPRSPKQRSQSHEAPIGPVLETPPADIELTDWDTWPERDWPEGDPVEETTTSIPEAASFEPEVAAAAVETDSHERPGNESSGGDEVLELKSAVDADTALAEHGIDPADDLAAEASEAETEPVALESTAGPEGEISGQEATEPDRVIEPEQRESPRDENQETDGVVEVVDEVEPAAIVDVLPEAIAEVVAVEEIEPTDGGAGETERPLDGVNESENDSEEDGDGELQAGFESSLLADIDPTNVEKDVRFRSPLLSDLDPTANSLEGIGLAPWRPDARLTPEPEEPEVQPRKRRFRGKSGR
ncbi:MAG: hypothetical protein KC438_06945 [Thermomicrobiales bacterium]|nr:hypothetical protein [Thermomicrobiales bacterium]